MKKTTVFLSAAAVCLSLSNAFGEYLGKSFQQGCALTTALIELVPGIGREGIDMAAAFWTQRKANDRLEIIQQGDREIVLAYSADAHRLRVDRLELGRRASSIVIELGPMGDLVAHDSSGRILLSAQTDGGTVILRGPDGSIVSKVVPAYREPELPTSAKVAPVATWPIARPVR